MGTIVICCADCGTAVPAGKKHCPQCGKRVGVGPSEDAAAISGNGGGISSAYEAALKRAQSYADMMHMSKKGIYDQLVLVKCHSQLNSWLKMQMHWLTS